jgi:hypothetical protein
MKWHYRGEMTIHPTDGGTPRRELVDEVYDLPEANVAIIRDFIARERDRILAYKYPSEDELWGDGYAQLMRELNELQPTAAMWQGVSDRQVMSALLAFRRELIENVDLYFPTREPLSAVA